MLKNEKCMALTEKFNRFYPGGHSNYRLPLKVTRNRVFISRAEGSRLWDVDGNEYIDYKFSCPVKLTSRIGFSI
jgi:glutamate-1-semialdehyde 2,1-aminomutase